jgi:hypothetical protein
LLLAASAAAAFAIYWLGPFRAAAQEKPIVAAPPSARAAPPAENAAASTRFLRIDVTPRDARVFVDERLIAGNPAVASVSAGAEHVIRIERDGYEPTLRRLVVTDDLQLDISLPALEAAGAPAASGTAKGKGRVRAWGRVPLGAAPPTSTPPSAAAAGKNCDPPYYFANGNKTYKPECI